MVNTGDTSSSEEISKMNKTIANLEAAVGTIQTELSKVSSSVDSQVSDIKKMFETLMGKPKGSEESLDVSDEVSSGDESLPDIAEMEVNIAKAKAKAEKRATREEKAKGSKSSPANGSGINSKIPPPQNYDSIHPTISMPHILNVGLPPMLNTNEFSSWKFEMESHISGSCTALWRSVVHGFHPHDASNLTPREDIESQLNKTALNIIQKALPREHLTHICGCKTAKEAWDSLDTLFQGNAIIQSSKYDVALDKAENFVMHEDESPEDLYRRLVTLANELRDFGKEEITDEWIKRKFVKAITPFEKNLSTSIRTRSDYNSLNSIGVLSEFIAISLSHKSADDALARSRGIGKSPNLALKSKAVARVEEVEEYDDDDEDYEDTYKGAHKCIPLPCMVIGRDGKLIRPVLQDPQGTRTIRKRGSGQGHAIIVEVQITLSKSVLLSQEKRMKASLFAKTRPKLLKIETLLEEFQGLYMFKKAPFWKHISPEMKEKMKL